MINLSEPSKLAQVNIAPAGGYTGFGPLGTPTGNGTPEFITLISAIIGVMTIVAIIWFVFVFITGAIGIISSSGDKQALETAKKKITSGVIGLVLTVIALFVLDIIGVFLGVDFVYIGSLLINIMK